jgi:hypothetical protein
VRAWIAVLATIPVLYDAFEIELEHLIMADTLFLFMVMAAVTIILWSPDLSRRSCLAGGLLLGASTTVRPIGLPLLAAFAIYLLVRLAPARPIRWRSLPSGAQPKGTQGRPPGRDLRRLVAAALTGGIAFALPVVGYESWYASVQGQFAMSGSTGVFLYSRVMTFADCSRMSPPTDLLPLCSTVPPDQRPIAQAYIWTSASPLTRLPDGVFSPQANSLGERFAERAIMAQPLDYARTVWDDTVRAFDWGRTDFPNGETYDEYLFGYSKLAVATSSDGRYPRPTATYVHGDPRTHILNPFAQIIRGYQRYVWLPGSVYGVILLIGLFGIVRRWRRAGSSSLLPWLCSVVLLVAPAATAEFDYRYVTTAVPFGCLAAAMAFGTARLTRHGASSGTDGGLADARHDERDLAPDAA